MVAHYFYILPRRNIIVHLFFSSFSHAVYTVTHTHAQTHADIASKRTFTGATQQQQQQQQQRMKICQKDKYTT